MKNIYKYIYIIASIPLLLLGSCDALLDQDKTDFGKGPNFVGFQNTGSSVSILVTGAEVNIAVPVDVVGPSVSKLSQNIEVTFEVIDSLTTAVEGVNYRLESNAITLTPNDWGDLYTAELPITIITEGIEVPLEGDAPVIGLSVTGISSEDGVMINQKSVVTEVSLAYSCPFDINDYAGTYLATTDEFGIYISDPVPFEVEVGPGDNQITLVNVAAHPEAYDVVVDIDPENGNLSIERQPVLNSNNIGYTYGELRWDGTGTSIPSPGHCVGVLDIAPNFTVDAGSFGPFRIVFEKQ
ncbi:hypothetical protein [Sinomicrobium soli]|uniref:hypothetical protein n=1 Tax=Sinomicrobium sp. N-1-3-6 TaxID=2219864 RepID=UPI000DCEC5E8|nr:hypothetical protein [Sinomicrobium sp. N-1-3-6]RAV28586.1 hypothetical protein DN748_13310 [Sinomicrobium sp. N-1-3-6]